MWRQHFLICGVLLLLVVPVYFADMFLLKSRGGGWIALDLRGLLFVPYIAFVVVHIGVSTLARRQFPSAGLVSLHVLCGMASIALLAVGLSVYMQAQRSRESAAYEKRSEQVKKLHDVIELRSWSFQPNADNPTEIHVDVRSHESGRFSGNAEGRAEGYVGELLFNTTDTPHRPVGKEEEFTYVFPLNFLKKGKIDSVSITLYLFKNETASVPEDITIIYEKDPATDYDGQFFYAPLPPPLTQLR